MPVDYSTPKPASVEVQNSALIYFDFNEPIVTNIVTSLLKAEEIETRVPEMDQLIYTHIFPNPFEHRTYIGLSGTEGPFSVVVHNLKGQKILYMTDQVNLSVEFDLQGLEHWLSNKSIDLAQKRQE